MLKLRSRAIFQPNYSDTARRPRKGKLRSTLLHRKRAFMKTFRESIQLNGSIRLPFLIRNLQYMKLANAGPHPPHSCLSIRKDFKTDSMLQTIKEQIVEKQKANNDLEREIDFETKIAQIHYDFLFKSKKGRETRSIHRQNFHCYFCSLNCHNMPILLKHLNLVHPMFTFKLLPQQNIKIRVNRRLEYFNGINTSSPNFDFFLCKNLVKSWNCCPPLQGLNKEFEPSNIDSEQELDVHRTAIVYTEQKINRMEGVNEDEKQFMKIWNLFAIKSGNAIFYASKLEGFLNTFSKELKEKNLDPFVFRHLVTCLQSKLITDGEFKSLTKLFITTKV